MLISLSIFILTMAGIIFRPFGIGFGSIAVFGAILSLVFGTVDWNDVYFIISIIWDSSLTLVGLIILSLVLDCVGFFECIALWIAKHNSSSPTRLFIFILLFGSVLSAMLANDGAVLILTPIVFALMKYFRAKQTSLIAFLLGVGFIADTTSNLFITSNLTNILSAEFFEIGFIEYVQKMLLPNLVAICSSILILYFYFHKALQIPFNPISLPSPKSVIKSGILFGFAWVILGFLFVGLIVGDAYNLPVSLFVLLSAIVFLLLAKKHKIVEIKKILLNAPWQVVWLSLGLCVVVYGLKNTGFTHYLSEFATYMQSEGKSISNLAVGLTSAMLSALMNNIPTVLIQNISLKDANLDFLVYGNIIGSNIGTKLTPIGSLATLLWLETLSARGVKISWKQYCKIGFIITPPVLIATLLSIDFL